MSEPAEHAEVLGKLAAAAVVFAVTLVIAYGGSFLCRKKVISLRQYKSVIAGWFMMVFLAVVVYYIYGAVVAVIEFRK